MTVASNRAIVVEGNLNSTLLFTGQIIVQNVPPAHVEKEEAAAAERLLTALPAKQLPQTARSLPPGSHISLPRDRAFVGRRPELLKLATLLKPLRAVIALTGPGGIGKTSLALEFAYRYGPYFAGGVFWVSFAEPLAIPTAIAACGGLRGMALDDHFSSLTLQEQLDLVYAAWNNSLPRLLIFDNCNDPSLLRAWRPAAGGCRLLLTSIPEAWSPQTGVKTLPLDQLPREDSIRLLRIYRPELQPDNPTLDAIAAQLGDLPLALDLAGHYLWRYANDVTPEAYLERLQQPDLLNHPSMQTGDLSPTHHATHVAKTFALSFKQISLKDAVDRTAHDLLASAACFAGGELLPRRLLRLTHFPTQLPFEIIVHFADAINRLIELGLLRQIETDGSLLLHRLLQHFVRLAVEESALQAAQEKVEQKSRQILQWPGHFGFEPSLSGLQAHLQVAIGNLYERHMREEKYDLAAWTQLLLDTRLLQWGQHALLIERHRLLLEKPLSAHNRLYLLYQLALAYRQQGQTEEASAAFRECLDLMEQPGEDPPDAQSQAWWVAAQGWLLNENLEKGELLEARQRAEDALQIARSMQEPWRIARAQIWLSRVARARGNLEEAERCLFKAQAQVDAIEKEETVQGFTQELAIDLLINRGVTLRRAGKQEAAADFFRQARDGAPGVSVRVLALNNLAETYLDMDRVEEARSLLQQALALCTEHGLLRRKGLVLHTLAELCLSQGEVETAIQHARAGARTDHLSGQLHCSSENESVLAHALLLAGDLNAAASAARRAARHATYWNWPYIHVLLAMIQLCQGQEQMAKAAFTEIVEQIHQRHPRPRDRYLSGVALAGLALLGRQETAAATVAFQHERSAPVEFGALRRARQLLDFLASRPGAGHLQPALQAADEALTPSPQDR